MYVVSMREENLKQVRDTQRGHRLTRYTLETLNVKRTAAFYDAVWVERERCGKTKVFSSGTHATRERHERKRISQSRARARLQATRARWRASRPFGVRRDMRFDWMDYDLTRS